MLFSEEHGDVLLFLLILGQLIESIAFSDKGSLLLY